MQPGPTERTFETDLAWCYDAVQDVSRTFAITVDVLDEPMSARICVGYLLCRIADTVEDAGHIPPEEQTEILRLYERVIDPEAEATVDEFAAAVEPWIPEDPNDDWQVVAQAPRVVRTFEGLTAGAQSAIRGPVCELVEGMAMFVDRYAEDGGLRIETIEELEEYCWYAAGTVGQLITNLVARSSQPAQARTLRENARSFALLLQLVNVAKDVADDYEEENNVYLPAEWLRAEGVEQSALDARENRGAVTRVIERVTDRASSYLDDAQIYLEHVPETAGNTLAAWAIPFLLAVGTIRELRKRPEDVLEEGGVKIPRAEVFAVIQLFDQGVSREALGDIRRLIERKPLHDADVPEPTVGD